MKTIIIIIKIIKTIILKREVNYKISDININYRKSKEVINDG